MTRAQYAKRLSDATLSGYMAGLNDRRNGGPVSKAESAKIRRAIRAEIARWLGSRSGSAPVSDIP